MRKSNQEIQPDGAVEALLASATLCRIAMWDGETPYVLAFNFGYADSHLYIHSAPEGKKISLLERHPRVGFEITERASLVKGEKACQWSTRYRSVVGTGMAEVIRDPEEIRAGLRIIMEQHGGREFTEYPPASLRRMVLIRIRILERRAKKSGNWDRIQGLNRIEATGPRIELKETDLSDLDPIHGLHSIPEVDRFNTLGIPGSKQESMDILQSQIDRSFDHPRLHHQWTLKERSSGDFLGLCGLNLSGDKFLTGEIWYKLLPAHWGKGYGTETARILIHIGFEFFGLHRVEAGAATGNLASHRVLEKAGMQKEGLRRGNLPIRGEWVDSFHFAILEDDPRNPIQCECHAP
ncbi:MAG: GNAT family N-acetyltransferase [Bacteroidales bacterium]